MLKEAIAVTQTKLREIHWVCSSNQGWLHSRALPRDTTATTSLWTQNDSAAATEPAALFSTRHRPRKGGPVFLLLLSQCWGLDVKCPPPKVPLPRAWSWRVSSKDISPLWTLLFLSLFPLSDSPHPTSPSFSLSSSWPPWDEKLCPTTCSLPLLEPSSNGACLVRKKKKNPYVVFSSFFVTAGKGWLNRKQSGSPFWHCCHSPRSVAALEPRG